MPGVTRGGTILQRRGAARAGALALALALGAAPVACDQGQATQPPGPSNTTSYHVSIFNACGAKMRIRKNDPKDEANTLFLFKNMRETITGTNETLWLIDDRGDAVAHYQPVQGKQSVRVTADCTAIVRE